MQKTILSFIFIFLISGCVRTPGSYLYSLLRTEPQPDICVKLKNEKESIRMQRILRLLGFKWINGGEHIRTGAKIISVHKETKLMRFSMHDNVTEYLFTGYDGITILPRETFLKQAKEIAKQWRPQ